MPFCASKCPYCDFYSLKLNPGGAQNKKLPEDYTNALIKQIKEYNAPAAGTTVDSIYIGGGTPPVIGIELILKIIKSINGSFSLDKRLEFTIEVNPASIDFKGLKKLKKAGVNRLSIGLQSAHDRELRVLSRRYVYADFIECYEAARAAGFESISFDLMYGIPTQSVKSFYETLKRTVSLKPEHISVYGLKLEQGTPFHSNIEKIRAYLPDEETERGMYFTCCDFLEKCGFNHYEISNFAKPGYECRHNLKYWTCGEYLGLGTGAHSYFGGCRFSFKKNIKEYIRNFNYDETKLKKIGVFDFEKYNLFDEYIEIAQNERIGEYIMLNFRLKSGINKNDFARLFSADFDDLYYEKTEPFIAGGHIIKTLGGYAFSREGMFVSNYILSRIIDFE